MLLPLSKTRALERNRLHETFTRSTIEEKEEFVATAYFILSHVVSASIETSETFDSCVALSVGAALLGLMEGDNVTVHTKSPADAVFHFKIQSCNKTVSQKSRQRSNYFYFFDKSKTLDKLT